MRKISLSSLLFVSLSLIGLPANAQTPDGVTPAIEIACNPLKNTGATRALYGLCVAFCEAQDLPFEINPGTKSQHSKLITQPPAVQLLANYNKKRNPSNLLDIEMPCQEVAICPCANLFASATIDGIGPNNEELELSCGPAADDPSQLRLMEDLPDIYVQYIEAFVDPNVNGNASFCKYLQTINEIDTGTVAVFPISVPQAQACQVLIQDKAAAINQVCG